MASGERFQVDGDAPTYYEQYVAPVMAPFITEMLDRLAPAPGSSLLDVACGTGFVSRRAKERVGESGRVVGVDLNPLMLAKAAEVTAGIELREASADALPFADGEFDALTCQQGFQFFPDRTAAAAEALRVLGAGARAAATVWTPMEDSPYFRAFYLALRDLAGAEGVATYAAAFEVGGEAVGRAFEEAGATEVEVETLHVEAFLPQIDEFVAGQILGTPWGPIFRELAPDGQQATVDRVVSALEDHREGDGVRVPFGADLVLARRAG